MQRKSIEDEPEFLNEGTSITDEVEGKTYRNPKYEPEDSDEADAEPSS